MSGVDMTIEICGMSGDGTIAAGALLNEALSEAGFHILAFDSYPAEIRGFGRCVTRTRVGDEEMLALGEHTQVLISLDDEQARSRVPFLAEGACVFFDNRPLSYVKEDQSIAGHVEPDVHLYGVPFGDLAAAASGTGRGRNLAALGAFAALFGLPQSLFEEVIAKKFGAKGQKVTKSNLSSFEAGYGHARESFGHQLRKGLVPPEKSTASGRILLSGNAAIAQGALDADLKLYFGYPITPATPIMEILAKALPKRGGRVVQMEDEISSIGAVLGSFYAGKRAMTATSGPGFALMTELITHGVMAETPAVILDAQRGGPSTGLPTKTEQSDLLAAVFGGPGDSPRIVIAPTNVSECYSYTLRSFQFAETYQTPVVVLTDFFLDNRVENVPPLKPVDEHVQDGNLYPDPKRKGGYRRFEITETGISPRAVPGMEGFMFTATGLEHTEKGMPDYTPENHMAMSEKRHRKIMGALRELPPPEEHAPEGPLDVGVVTWGSSVGAALEAVRMARKEGMRVGGLKITTLFPYHADKIRTFMGRCKEVLVPELNYGGQLSNLIGHLFPKEVVRLNYATGVPIFPKTIFDKIKQLL